DIDQLDRRLVQLVKQNFQMQAIQAIPGIGPLTATALVATATELSSFDSGRQFAAWLGLTPRQTGTGGKTRQLGISKRGDAYVRPPADAWCASRYMPKSPNCLDPTATCAST